MNTSTKLKALIQNIPKEKVSKSFSKYNKFKI